jgi:hypothetical protein
MFQEWWGDGSKEDPFERAHFSIDELVDKAFDKWCDHVLITFMKDWLEKDPTILIRNDKLNK